MFLLWVSIRIRRNQQITKEENTRSPSSVKLHIYKTYLPTLSRTGTVRE